ncbi:MAG: FAD-binding oxidoreductase [Thermoplasmata archaeon]|nr:FAD-binding oxidoreductase [Thermoplasmata archaeon]
MTPAESSRTPPTNAPVPANAPFEELRAGLRGALLLPADPGYEAARHLFNAMVDRRPAAIAQCVGTADVVHAVNFARAQGLRLSVRGGGHNVAGQAIVDGGLVIDLSRMRAVRVDSRARRLWAQGGATWGDVDRESQLFGLATPGGLVSSTGIGGFTLGGGIGWLAREHGLACDNLVGAEVVSSTGTVLQVSASDHPDLLWALRGGGGNFGVVTSIEYALHPVGPGVYGGALFYRREHAAELLTRYATFAAHAPERLTTLVVLMTGPPGPFLPAEVHGRPLIAFAACFDGSKEDGAAALGPLREALGAPVADLMGPIPYTVLQGLFDASAPTGRLHYWKSHHLKQLDASAAAEIVRAANAAASPFTEVHLHQLGGRSLHEPEGGAAFSNRSSPFILNLIAQWTQPAETEANVRWARESWDRIRPHATGDVYVNFLTETEPAAVASAYGKSQLGRLRELKTKYDPDDLFRATHRVDGAGRPPA